MSSIDLPSPASKSVETDEIAHDKSASAVEWPLLYEYDVIMCRRNDGILSVETLFYDNADVSKLVGHDILGVAIALHA